MAVPIDSSLRCVALVRGLPATRVLMTTNDGATTVHLTWCKAMPTNRLEVVSRSVSASSPLPSQNACAPRLHSAFEAIVRLETPQVRQASNTEAV